MEKTEKMLELESKLGEPIEDFLRREYVDNRKSQIQIAKEHITVTQSTIGRWLINCGIERPPIGFTKPTKEELEQKYIHEHKSTTQIAEELGVNNTTVGRWLNQYNIPVRTASESMLPKDFAKPTKEELDQLYTHEHKSTIKIAEELGVNHNTVRNWLKQYNIQIRSPITSSEKFIEFLKQDPTAATLAATATSLNGQSYDIEKIITDLYGDKFKDKKQLHQLLQENRKEILELVQQGITNLGPYLGEFTLQDRGIIPILIDETILTLPENTITTSLEDRLVNLLRNEYSPKFNKDRYKTLEEIQAKIQSSEGKKQEIYQKLEAHYQEVLDLEIELENA